MSALATLRRPARAGARLGMLVALIICTCAGAAPVLAVQPDEMLSDRALEARARALSRELRCMVCQNQSIDDSDAPLARDLRILVRERLQAGDSNAQVLDFLTARYGEFVLLKPRLAWHTALLWFGPPTLLVIGAITIFFASRRRSGKSGAGAAGDAAKLTVAEESRLAELTRAQQE